MVHGLHLSSFPYMGASTPTPLRWLFSIRSRKVRGQIRLQLYHFCPLTYSQSSVPFSLVDVVAVVISERKLVFCLDSRGFVCVKIFTKVPYLRHGYYTGS